MGDSKRVPTTDITQEQIDKYVAASREALESNKANHIYDHVTVALQTQVDKLNNKLDYARTLLSKCAHGISTLDECDQCPVGARTFKLYQGRQ